MFPQSSGGTRPPTDHTPTPNRFFPRAMGATGPMETELCLLSPHPNFRVSPRLSPLGDFMLHGFAHSPCPAWMTALVIFQGMFPDFLARRGLL